MKVRPKIAGQVSSSSDVAPVKSEAPPVETKQAKPVQFEAAGTTAKEKLTDAATKAATEAAVNGGEFNSPLLEKFGEHVGLALGVIVTEALALSKSWNAPLMDASGRDVQSIEGAERIGEHDLRKRHQQVVGPKVAAIVEKLQPGVVHELLEGLARGASNAPGTSYRIEAKISDWLHGASK